MLFFSINNWAHDEAQNVRHSLVTEVNAEIHG